MNIMFIDLHQFNLEEAQNIYDRVIEISGTSNWVALPKSIEILEDVSADWLRSIRDVIDKELEKYDKNNEQKDNSNV